MNKDNILHKYQKDPKYQKLLKEEKSALKTREKIEKILDWYFTDPVVKALVEKMNTGKEPVVEMKEEKELITKLETLIDQEVKKAREEGMNIIFDSAIKKGLITKEELKIIKYNQIKVDRL